MNKSKTTGKVLYVQLSRDETRIAILGSAEAPSITLQTPAGAMGDGIIQNVEAIRTMLRNVLKQPEFKGVRKVVFTLCTSQVITEVADDIPANVSGKSLEKLLQANVDKYFPVVDMKDYKLVWQVIGPKGGNSKEQLVQLWAVPINMLTRYYQVANAANLQVERIDYCGHSVASAIGASFTKPVKPKERAKLSLKTEISFGKKKEKQEEAPAEAAPARQIRPTQLHVLLESDMIGVTFVQDGQVMLQRFIRCGANPAHQFDELAMMVDYYGSTEAGRGSSITGFVCGGLVEKRSLVDDLADTLGIPLQVQKAAYEPKWTLCMGAAMGKLEFGMPSLNVMKPGRQVESQLWQYILMLGTGLVLVGAVLLLMTSRLSWEAEQSKLKTQQQTLMIQLQQTAGYADKYDKYVSEYNKYSSDWDTIFGSLRTYNDNLVLALQELEATLPEHSSVVGLQISADGLTVQFSCSSKEEAAYLIMALREMEYMELVGISNLSGGGGGPVDSYGPQEGEGEEGEEGEEGGTEAPPTEGDYSDLTDAEKQLLAGLLAENMDRNAVIEVFMGLDDQELDTLERVYGKKPANKYASLELLRNAYATKDIFNERKAALTEMLNNNPFAVRTFVDLVMEDVWAPEPILFWYIYDDLMLPENADLLDMIMGGGSMQDPKQAFEMLNRMLVIMTKNDETLTATEDLIRTDKKMETWYIYYLEMELGLQKRDELEFLDMDLILEDLMAGSFNTGNKELDKKLNALVPEEVWDMLEQIKENGSSGGGGGGNNKPKPDKPGPDDYNRMDLMRYMAQYIQNGKSEDAYLNQLIKNYLATGKSGDDRWDEFLKPYEKYLKNEGGNELPNPVPDDIKKPSDYQQGDLMSMLFMYMNSGSTGDKDLDKLIDNYLMTGSTGDDDWDKFLEPYKQYLNPDLPDDDKNPSGKYPYYFTVALKYKDALKDAELDRKGLNKDDKIEKVEVLP